jgi:hypothetical protein
MDSDEITGIEIRQVDPESKAIGRKARDPDAEGGEPVVQICEMTGCFAQISTSSRTVSA